MCAYLALLSLTLSLSFAGLPGRRRLTRTAALCGVWRSTRRALYLLSDAKMAACACSTWATAHSPTAAPWSPRKARVPNSAPARATACACVCLYLYLSVCVHARCAMHVLRGRALVPFYTPRGAVATPPILSLMCMRVLCPGRVLSLGWSADDRLICAGMLKGHVRIFNAATGPCPVLPP
jgi:hypothetical protein